MNQQIQWFPGHMSKTIRDLSELKANIVILILDARAPLSSFTSSLEEIIKNKKLIILLNKADLVDKNELDKYINILKNKIDVYKIKKISLKTNINNLKKELKADLENVKVSALIKKVIVMGVPNVGKSTLINILLGKSSAKVENRAGVTKKEAWFQIDNRIWLLDTPGILQPKFESNEQAMNLAIVGSIKIDLLPLEEIVVYFISKLIERNIIIDFIDPFKFIEKECKNNKISYNDVLKKIILDFQSGKYGKIILD